MVLSTTRKPILTEEEHANAKGYIETILSDTIERVADLHERWPKVEQAMLLIPGLKLNMEALVAASTASSQAAVSWAETYKKSVEDRKEQDQRYDSLARRFDDLVKTNVGIGQMPIRSHREILWSALTIVGVVCLIAVVGMLSFFKYEIRGSLDSIEISQQQAQRERAEVKRELERTQQAVSEAAKIEK